MPTDGAKLGPIILVFAFGYLALAVNSYSFIFVAPVIAELLIVLCLMLAVVTAKAPRVADNGVRPKLS